MNKIKILFVLLIATMGFLSCKTVSMGSSENPTKLKNPKENKISPAKALELAKPHLQKSWELGCKSHSDPKHWCVTRANRAIVHIVQKGNYYYLRKTSYPYKTFTAYLYHAVKVHVNSGQVTPPVK
jgi:hypothetical protein